MKKLLLLLTSTAVLGFTSCGTVNEDVSVSSDHTSQAYSRTSPIKASAVSQNAVITDESIAQADVQEDEQVNSYEITITAGDTTLDAVLEKNATTDYLVEQMPFTVPMMDLYGREMCYRYGAYALPTDDLRSDGYEIGDIAYWPPGGSLVILYKQNGEEFERQHLGHIDSGVELFETTGDTDVTFALKKTVDEYQYTIQDVRNLQDFLLAKPTDENLVGKPYDLTGDDRWDVFDLCLMKRELLNAQSQTAVMLDIEADGTHLTASLADSTAAKELVEKLKAEPVTITLNEYGGFEKVGKLPWSLTRADASTETEPCDIMLYQGNQMTIFYNSNSWSYTKLGHIENKTQKELKSILGEGDVTVTLSLK